MCFLDRKILRKGGMGCRTSETPPYKDYHPTNFSTRARARARVCVCVREREREWGEIKQYQKKSTERTNNKTEYTRKYVQGVAEGDAFKRSSRSLAKA